VYWFGRENSHNILVLELLDKNLETVTQSNRTALSMMTILLIIEQMLSRLEAIH